MLHIFSHPTPSNSEGFRSSRILQKFAYLLSALGSGRLWQAVFLIYLAGSAPPTYGEFTFGLGWRSILLLVVEIRPFNLPLGVPPTTQDGIRTPP